VIVTPSSSPRPWRAVAIAVSRRDRVQERTQVVEDRPGLDRDRAAVSFDRGSVREAGADRLDGQGEVDVLLAEEGLGDHLSGDVGGDQVELVAFDGEIEHGAAAVVGQFDGLDAAHDDAVELHVRAGRQL
jgi:hypothetical protein